MPDLMSALSGAAEAVKRLRTLSKSVENAEMMTLLADLQDDLANAKLDLANLKAELAQLKGENRDLKERLGKNDNEKPAYKDGAYTFEGDSGYYCTGCFDTQQKKVRLSPLTGGFEALGRWNCPVCKAVLG